MTETQLQDEGTAAFIQDFVQKHGGIEEATRQLDASAGEMAPEPPQRTTSRSAPPHNPLRGAPHPPPRGGAPPPPPHRGSVPPPPPPIGGGPPLPPPVPKGKGAQGGGSKPPPPHGDGNARANLLSSIRDFKGSKLTHVSWCSHTCWCTDAPYSTSHVHTTGMVPLSTAQVDETLINDRSSALGSGNVQAPASSSGGLAGALAKALQARQQAIQVSDDSEEEEDEEDDDEWED